MDFEILQFIGISHETCKISIWLRYSPDHKQNKDPK